MRFLMFTCFNVTYLKSDFLPLSGSLASFPRRRESMFSRVKVDPRLREGDGFFPKGDFEISSSEERIR
jgi:hypothetical protein